MIFLISTTAWAERIQWNSLCPKIDKKMFNWVLIKKCLDKQCKVKITKSNMSGFAGKHQDYWFGLLVGKQLMRTEFPATKTLGYWGEHISNLCPGMDTNKFKNLKIKDFATGYKKVVYHLSKDKYKEHWFYKQYNKSGDPCIKLNKIEGSSSLILYLKGNNSKKCLSKKK